MGNVEEGRGQGVTEACMAGEVGVGLTPASTLKTTEPRTASEFIPWAYSAHCTRLAPLDFVVKLSEVIRAPRSE